MSEAEGKEQASGGRLTAKAIAPKIRSCHEALKQTKRGIAVQADRSFRAMLPCFACLVAGLLLGSTGPRLASSRQPAGTKPADLFSMQARLGANLYIQTAAEYRACCLQVYKTAEIRLEALLAAANPKPLKPAVIMDLDETVLDNSAFESFLFENDAEYSDDLWEMYERDYPGAVRLVPGAQQFIKKAEERGVTVIFISNRLEENCGSTANALQRLGINTEGIEQRLLLKKKGASSDKTSRREMAAARYNVLLTFGDNLRDFSETFIAGKLTANDGLDACKKAIDSRFRSVDDAACHWGIDWFVLPNPGYGEWEKLIRNEPMTRLRPSGMKLPAGKQLP
jgi:acid phosphatase